MNATQHPRRPTSRLAAGALCLAALAACSSPGSTSTSLPGSTSTSLPGSTSTSLPGAETTSGGPATTSAPPSPTASAGESPGPEEAATADVVGARTLDPVPVRTPARFGEGLTVTVTSVREAHVTAVYPGEVSGPGMVVRLTFTNLSPDPVDLDGVRVSATRADGSPATAMEGPPYAAPTGVLDVGASADATFVYSIPQGSARSTTLEITSVSSSDTVTVDV